MGRFVLVVALLLSVAVAERLFINGRPRGGFRQAPLRTSKSATPLPSMWFSQAIDHFDPQNNNTWQQRYFMNTQYYQAGGPVFLLLGGEGTENPIWLQEDTQIVVWAQQFHAMLFTLEHRFYGESQPFADLSVESLAYLTSEQALADAAYFHDYASHQYNLPASTSWVCFGGSYSGALSAWLRLKYPASFVGAVATSAPVQPELDFSQYLDVVTASLTTMSGSRDCVTHIGQATALISDLLGTASGRQTLSTMFQTCTPLTTNALDIQNFVSTLAGNFEGVVQYNGDNRAFEGAVDTNVTIPVICGLMNDNTVSSVLQRYANVNSLILQTYSTPCLDFAYADLVAGLANTTLAAGMSGARQWTYQTCTEFGFYQSSDSPNQPFGSGFPLSFSIQQCMDAFGPQFNQAAIAKGIQWTLDNYGGYDVAGTNIVMPNGSVDPWHFLGVLADVSPTVNAIFISGTAHCADMYPATPSDPPQLVAARVTVGQHIASWLGSTSAGKATAPSKPTMAVA